MTHHVDANVDLARGRNIVSRWCSLAEQRLEYLTELFETGRWRRFHTEREFLENIQEAKAAVELWRSLETREASLDNAAIDLSWLGRRQSAQRLSERDLSP
ncbi:MAG: TIGR03809 family protein, partial [Bradyrhizobium sp.]